MLGVSPCHTYSMVFMPPPAHASAHDGEIEFGMLQQSYTEYSGALRDSCVEASKSRMITLSDYLQAKGVYGSNALQLLQKYSAQINWQGMNHDVFSSFYRFVYFICREPGKRNVQVGTAVSAWRLVLCGRFRLLDQWCSYVSQHHKAVVLEDTWRQVLDFSRTVHEDLSNYDPASAWPVLLDEFVEYIKGRGQHRPQPLFVEPLDLNSNWSMRAIAAVSPRSGSKRRPPDVLEVADQLQQLPLLGSGSEAHAAVDSTHAAHSIQRAVLAVKRARLHGQQLHQFLSGGDSSGAAVGAAAGAAAGAGEQPLVAAAADDIGMRAGSSRRAAGSARGAGGGCSAVVKPGGVHLNKQHQQGQQQFQLGAMGPPAPVHAHQQQHRMLVPCVPSNIVAPAGLAMHEPGFTGGPGVWFGQQQQRLHDMDSLSLAGSRGSSMDVSMSSPPQQQAGRGQQQQQLSGSMYMPGHHGHASAQLPPCPSPGHVHPQQHHFRNEADLKRTNNVIAMMQVTVTEALGFN